MKQIILAIMLMATMTSAQGGRLKILKSVTAYGLPAAQWIKGDWPMAGNVKPEGQVPAAVKALKEYENRLILAVWDSGNFRLMNAGEITAIKKARAGAGFDGTRTATMLDLKALAQCANAVTAGQTNRITKTLFIDKRAALD
jgi:hypothetical protein